ncbi:aldehyde dehydrogenase family protein [Streptomyces sp. NPDC005202]|uniref:aldehyde dehydrogenase family protein n=1 Tax=Streptomyces sp. NPDC005202 TaxID=3157021 RepID=UPI0033A87CA9
MATTTQEPAGVARARMMLQRARWAASAFAGYDRERVLRIASAVTEAASARAAHYAEWAVRETGFGVVEHKRLKNELCSRGIFEHYRDEDLVSARLDPERKIVEIPRPAGVIFALTPSTNPVSTVYFKVILALLTRNAIVISPHPMARECCTDAARWLADAAERAGAPDGAVQVVEQPSIPLIEALMADERTNVILATGGTAVVRAAYRSGNPALGVGPGNGPVLVDATADPAKAAQRIVDSKSFDNSVLCTNESVLIAETGVADPLLEQMRRQGAHLCTPEERDRLRNYLFPEGHFRVAAVGKDAAWIARECGITVPTGTRVLLAPFDLAVPEEPLAHEKLCPVLGLVQVPDAKRGIDVSRAVLRITGAGHSAAIHSNDPATIMAFAAAVNVLRVSVNAGSSTGSAGFDTNLAPSMTIGTGYLGRSSVGENLRPHHLVDVMRVAYNSDPAEPFGDFTGLQPWTALPGRAAAPAQSPAAGGAAEETLMAELREEIRRLVLEELQQLNRR